MKFFGKNEKLYDDGHDSSGPDMSEVKEKVIYVVHAVYGIVVGFVACNYVKYLDKRYACYAWGIPLTSKPVPGYPVAQILVTFLCILIVYALVGGLTVLGNRVWQALIKKKTMKQKEEVMDRALALVLLLIVLVSVVFAFVPFNIFLIGVD